MFLSERTDTRNNNFDILRFLAAVHILIHHGVQCFGNKNPHWFSFLGSIESLFIIGGFLITKSWYDSPNFFVFFKKRILRIFPALIVVVLFTALILGPLVTTLPLKEYFTNSMFFDYLKNIFLVHIYHLLPGVFQSNPFNTSVNGSLWTLPLEFLLYCLVAFFGISKILNKKYFHFVFVVVAIIVFYIITYLNIAKYWSYVQSVNLLIFFFISSSFYIYRKKIILSFPLFIICLAVFVVGINLSYKFYLHFFYIRFLVLPYIIIYIAYCKIPYINNFGKYGDFSYGIYLWAFPVSQTLVYFLLDKFNIFTYIVSVFLVTLFIAVLSFKFIEKPALKLKNKKIYKSLF